MIRAGREIYPFLIFGGNVRISSDPPVLTGGYRIQKGLKKLEKDTNLLLVDWLTFRNNSYSVSQIIDILGLGNCDFQEQVNGRYGYRKRITFDGITILSDGHQENMGICVDMSGSGCRTFDTYSSLSWADLFSWLNDPFEECSVTRLDLAFDDRSGLLNMDTLLEYTDEHFYTSQSRWWLVEYGSCGSTIYHGSPQSDTRIRIYDKAAERGYLDGSVHWVRVEIVFRKDNANGAVDQLCRSSIGRFFSGVLRNYLCYREPGNDSNTSRWQVCEWWEKLLNSVDPISVFVKKDQGYNLFNLQQWLVNTCGSAIRTWHDIVGLDELMDLIKQRNAPLPAKYRRLIEIYEQN